MRTPPTQTQALWVHRCAHSHWGVLGHLPADPPVGWVMLWLCLDPSCSLWPCKITSMPLEHVFPCQRPRRGVQAACAVWEISVCPRQMLMGWLLAMPNPVCLSSSFLPSPRSVTETPGNILSKKVRKPALLFSVLRYVAEFFTYHVPQL